MPRLRSFVEMVAAVMLVVGLAFACAAQEVIGPPGPPPNQQPVPGAAFPSVAAPPNGGLPSAAAPWPELSPAESPPGPDSWQRDNRASAPPGDVMGLGDFGGRGGMMEGFGGGMFRCDSIRYTTTWFPNVPVQGQAAQFQMVGQDLSFTHPLWSDTINTVGLTGGVRNRLDETDAILPDTGQPYPANLWDVRLGLMYVRQLNNGWVAGGGLSIGSASDHPFAAIQEMYVGMNAMLRVPQGEHNAWVFSLMYSPTGELNFPVPGVAFSYNPSPQFHANIGLPLMVLWRPSDDFQFQASYMLIRTIHVKAAYRLTTRLSAFAAYDWSNEEYELLDRPEENDRFFTYDQRVSLGLQMMLLRNWTASLSAGYVFDRYSFEGTSLFSSSDFDRVNLGSGPFVSLNLGVRY